MDASAETNEHSFYSARPSADFPGASKSLGKSPSGRRLSIASAHSQRLGADANVPLPRHPNAHDGVCAAKTFPRYAFAGPPTPEHEQPATPVAKPYHTLPVYAVADSHDQSRQDRESYNSEQTRGLIQGCANDQSASGTLHGSIDPCPTVPVRPHKAPNPVASFHASQKPLHALFGGQFGQLLDDHMVQFRPAVSQHNVNAPLESNHPYQRAATVKMPAKNVSPPANLPGAVSRPGSLVVPDFAAMAQSPAQNSFLPKGCRANIGEPQASAMSYTPPAFQLEEMKDNLPPAAQCWCLRWPF